MRLANLDFIDKVVRLDFERNARALERTLAGVPLDLDQARAEVDEVAFALAALRELLDHLDGLNPKAAA